MVNRDQPQTLWGQALDTVGLWSPQGPGKPTLTAPLESVVLSPKAEAALVEPEPHVKYYRASTRAWDRMEDGLQQLPQEQRDDFAAYHQQQLEGRGELRGEQLWETKAEHAGDWADDQLGILMGDLGLFDLDDGQFETRKAEILSTDEGQQQWERLETLGGVVRSSDNYRISRAAYLRDGGQPGGLGKQGTPH